MLPHALVLIFLVAFAPAEASARPDRSGETTVYASWYRVPPNSLARRRAGRDELTAAHNKLPLGTQVRVTNPANNRSVIVRITDRGVRHRRARLDLCKEAATELDMLRVGVARVRMEVVSGNPKQAAGNKS